MAGEDGGGGVAETTVNAEEHHAVDAEEHHAVDAEEHHAVDAEEHHAVDAEEHHAVDAEEHHAVDAEEHHAMDVEELQADVSDSAGTQQPQTAAIPAADFDSMLGFVPSDVDCAVDLYFGSDYFSAHRVLSIGRGRGRSGFYKVPAVLRRRAGTAEASLLYDPKHVNFREIGDLLLQQPTEQQTEAHRQLSHFFYHLHCYADGGKRERIESLMQQLYRYKMKIETSDLDPEERLHWSCVDPAVAHRQPWCILIAVGFLGDLFRRSYDGSLSVWEDPECAHSWATELWSDLLLLENQIPLFRLTFPDYLVQLFLHMGSYFADVVPLNQRKWFRLLVKIAFPGSDRYCYLHILHFVHEMLLPNTHDKIGKSSYCSSWGFLWSKIRRHPRRLRWGRERAPSSRMKPIPTVTRLQSAGVVFKPVAKKGFAVEFKKGVLKLPRLHVSQSTKKMLANLIAWEMCHRDAPRYFINYVIFMDHLINTAKDVEILIHSKVFEHSLATDDEVKTFFDGLGQGLVYTKPEEDQHKRYDIFPKLTMEIDKYYQSRPNKWLANLMQEYFKSPWTIISFVAASLLLLLTAVQAFFAVYAFERPP